MMFRSEFNRTVIGRLAVVIFSRICALVLTMCLATLAHAQAPDLVSAPVNSAERILLPGHHPSWANDQNDIGAVPPDLQLESLTLVLARPAEREQTFEQFLKDQQNPSSPEFHHWLTPVEIGQRFGVSEHDIEEIKGWLESQNLHFDSVASSLVRIRFSGPASAVSNAFGAELRYYMVNEEKRISISGEAQIPAALSNVIQSVNGLSTIHNRPMHHTGIAQMPDQKITLNTTGALSPAYTTTCSSSPCFFISPADFATIYDINSVYQNGMHGEGQTIAIIGQSAVNPADITNFQIKTALPQMAPTVIVPPNGIAPPPPATTQVGDPSGDQEEATLDVTRAGSIAYGATIDLVVSASTATTGGINIAAEYVVDTTPVPARIMSISYGGCEAENASGVSFWDSLFKQAAGEGISTFVASGDAGAAGCDTFFGTPPANQIASPNYVCSSSYATCVGGTEFADTANPNLYWRSTNSAGLESAISYVPEGAWNEPTTSTGQFQAAATGGGVSSVIPTPSWQTGAGVPAARAGRYTPDVAFSSSEHDGYFACFAAKGASCTGTSSEFISFSGTSAAAPDMAGVAALLDQSEGNAQGNLNPILYELAATASFEVFNDITVAMSGVSSCAVTTPSMCNNSTPGPSSLTGGLSGFLVDAGYDEATGLGSINVANLLTNWNSSVVGTAASATSVTSNLNPSTTGESVIFMVTVTTASPSATGAVTLNDGTTELGTAVLSKGTINTTASATFAVSTLASGSNSIIVVYGGDSNFAGSVSPVLAQVVSGNNPAPSISSISPSSGAAGQAIPVFSAIGSNFINGATINFGGTNYPGAVAIGGAAISASIPASAAPSAGTVPVFVVNPAPGGGASNTAIFTVNNAVPVITSISPSSGLTGQAIATLTVTGLSFVTGATVTFNGTSNPGTVSNGGATIKATVAASEVGAAGIVPVTVVNPTPGGGASNSVNFTINDSVPSLTSISPTTAATGTTVVVTATGAGFVNGSTMVFNGISVTGTVTMNGTTLTATIAGSSLATAGTVAVTISNPAPGGGTSNALNFVIDNFSVSGPTLADTITAGQSATFALNFDTQGGALPAIVNFSASNLPPEATAMFSPASLPAGSVSGATTFTLTTTAHSAVAPDFWHLPAFHPFMGVWFTILALMALLADRTRRNGRRYGLRLLGSGALLMVCGMLIAGCNGVTTGVAAPPATSATGTSAGTYTITVTATTGSATRTATVTLIVQ